MSGFNFGAAEFVPSWGNGAASLANDPMASYQNTFANVVPKAKPGVAEASAVTEPEAAATKEAAAAPEQVASSGADATTSDPATPAEEAGDDEASAAPSAASVPATDHVAESSDNVSAEKPKAKPAPAPAAEPESESESDDDEDEADDAHKKEHLNLVFIGHVDAGKSTMGGNILFLTGMVDKRTMEKYEREAKELGRESWYLSWALDLTQEERNKGKTTEYGRGYFETEKRSFTVLDAPGHKTFVPSMIQSAGQADIGVLVISARKGEFETGFDRGGQTREHAILAKTVGVRRLILVVNKMDDATVGWSKERYDECVGRILPFLKGVGYNPKTDLDIMPVSGFTGANIKDRVDPKICNWYDGPSLIELLDNMKLTERVSSGPLMLPISDKFRDMGTMILGKIEVGKVRVGHKVLIMPNRHMAEVATIYIEEKEAPMAKAGDNVRLRLKGVEEEDVMPGFMLCRASHPVDAVSMFEAQLKIVEYHSIICAGYTAVMHIHTATEEVTIDALLHSIDKKTKKKTKAAPRFVRQGDTCIVRFKLQQPVVMDSYANTPQLGRFTIRDEGKTVAIGVVLKLIVE